MQLPSHGSFACSSALCGADGCVLLLRPKRPWLIVSAALAGRRLFAICCSIFHLSPINAEAVIVPSFPPRAVERGNAMLDFNNLTKVKSKKRLEPQHSSLTALAYTAADLACAFPGLGCKCKLLLTRSDASTHIVSATCFRSINLCHVKAWFVLKGSKQDQA